MEIEVVEKRENKLLNRTEVRFKIIHTGQRTTERELVRSDLAEMFKVNKDRVIVDHIKSGFGIQESMSYAKIYKTVDDATKVEPKYILKRNRVVIGKEKEVKEGAKEAASEEKKVVEKSQPEIKPGEKQGNEDKLDEGEKPETQRVEGTRDSTKQKQKTEDSGGVKDGKE